MFWFCMHSSCSLWQLLFWPLWFVLLTGWTRLWPLGTCSHLDRDGKEELQMVTSSFYEGSFMLGHEWSVSLIWVSLRVGNRAADFIMTSSCIYHCILFLFIPPFFHSLVMPQTADPFSEFFSLKTAAAEPSASPVLPTEPQLWPQLEPCSLGLPRATCSARMLLFWWFTQYPGALLFSVCSKFFLFFKAISIGLGGVHKHMIACCTGSPCPSLGELFHASMDRILYLRILYFNEFGNKIPGHYIALDFYFFCYCADHGSCLWTINLKCPQGWMEKWWLIWIMPLNR